MTTRAWDIVAHKDQLRIEELETAIKEACRLMNYDGEKPLARLLEARAVLVAAIQPKPLKYYMDK